MTFNPQSLSDLDFELTRSPKVKCDGAVGLSICDFLLVSNSNTWSNSGPLPDISLRNRSDLDSDLSSSRQSKVIASMDSPFMSSYLCLIVTYGLTLLLYKIQGVEIWVSLTLTYKVTQGQMWWYHMTLHIWFPVDIYSNCMSTSHLSVYPQGSIVNFKFAKKIVTNHKLIISKIRNSTFVRTTQTPVQEKMWKIHKWFVGGIAFWALAPIGWHVEANKKSWNIKTQNFKNTNQ